MHVTSFRASQFVLALVLPCLLPCLLAWPSRVAMASLVPGIDIPGRPGVDMPSDHGAFIAAVAEWRGSLVSGWFVPWHWAPQWNAVQLRRLTRPPRPASTLIVYPVTPPEPDVEIPTSTRDPPESATPVSSCDHTCSVCGGRRLVGGLVCLGPGGLVEHAAVAPPSCVADTSAESPIVPTPTVPDVTVPTPSPTPSPTPVPRHVPRMVPPSIVPMQPSFPPPASMLSTIRKRKKGRKRNLLWKARQNKKKVKARRALKMSR